MTVKVSTLLVLIVFFIDVFPETPSAKLITAKAVLESVMNSPAISESVTVNRYKYVDPDVDVSVGTQEKKALLAPVPCLITVQGPLAPAVEDSHLNVLVSTDVALSDKTLTVKVSVMPTFK